ncbi:hypothetical protein HK096_000122 [Nowakowskiella sp. JEL0078]|nr:hypothetical protein HK096_000122 [Nowakowskiella sp. JEL0078]
MKTNCVTVSNDSISFTPKISLSDSTYPLHLFSFDTVENVDESERLKFASMEILKDNLVAFPTESVYGLGANALSSSAVSKIYSAKGRPSDNPLIIHISSLQMLETLLSPSPSLRPPPPSYIPTIYHPLIARFWPGPLTILVPAPVTIPSIVTAGQPTLAVRFPSHPIARALISHANVPLAAPSANISGRPSPTLAKHVLSDLDGRIGLVIDGGECESGVESTVVDGLREVPVVLRPGGVTVEMLRLVKGWEDVRVYKKGDDLNLEENPTTPGMKYRHYSPDAVVWLFEFKDVSDEITVGLMRNRIKEEFESLVAEGVNLKEIGFLRTLNKFVSIDGTTLEYYLGSYLQPGAVAKELFKGLRDLEARGAKYILVEGILEQAEGAAVLNRLRKAASRTIHV